LHLALLCLLSSAQLELSSIRTELTLFRLRFPTAAAAAAAFSLSLYCTVETHTLRRSAAACRVWNFPGFFSPFFSLFSFDLMTRPFLFVLLLVLPFFLVRLVHFFLFFSFFFGTNKKKGHRVRSTERGII
jgi:hypothetical protein